MDHLDDAVAVFTRLRPRLFGIAYRMLSSATEAEDLVQIADILRAREPGVRQLVSRARKHIADERRQPADPAAQKELLTSFIAAARAGDMAALEQLFAADVTSMSDGNGMVRVSVRPVTGVTRVARFMTAISTWFWDDVELQWMTTNGQSSVAVIRGGKVACVLTVNGSADGVEHVLWMFNPDKIAAATRPA